MSRIYHSPYAYGMNTCYAPFLLRKDVLDQLAFVKAYCGLQTVRCHGIFHDRIGIASRKEDGTLQFHFELAHRVYDNLLDIGLKPFIELSFLPRVLAMDPDKTVCFYQAHASNPASYKEYGALIAAFARSLLKRYGRREPAQWHFEVWNEPNLQSFWQTTGDPFAEYVKLYAAAAKAVKSVCPAWRVGGPATARAQWIREFILACKRNRLPVDFVSTHLYAADEYELYGNDVRQRYGLYDFYPQTIHTTTDLIHELLPSAEVLWTETNAIQRSMHKTDKTRAYPSWELFAGEPTWGKRRRDDLHPGGAFAALVAGTMLRHDVKLFWWTATDHCEEWEPDHAPYYGGRGLVNLHGIPKPNAHALHFAWLMDGGTIRAQHAENGAGYLAVDKGSRRLLLVWNFVPPEAKPEMRLIELADSAAPRKGDVRMFLVDETHANGRLVWEKLGAPMDPDPAQHRRILCASQLTAQSPTRLLRGNRLAVQPNTFALLTSSVA